MYKSPSFVLLKSKMNYPFEKSNWCIPFEGQVFNSRNCSKKKVLHLEMLEHRVLQTISPAETFSLSSTVSCSTCCWKIPEKYKKAGLLVSLCVCVVSQSGLLLYDTSPTWLLKQDCRTYYQQTHWHGRGRSHLTGSTYRQRTSGS